MPEVPVTLVSIGEGAMVELFDIELEKVLRNIADVNTDPTQAREITLKVRIKPDEDRAVGGVKIVASSKLASNKGAATLIYMGKRGNQFVAVENNPKQSALFDQPKPTAVPANVSPIERK